MVKTDQKQTHPDEFSSKNSNQEPSFIKGHPSNFTYQYQNFQNHSYPTHPNHHPYPGANFHNYPPRAPMRPPTSQYPPYFQPRPQVIPQGQEAMSQQTVSSLTAQTDNRTNAPKSDGDSNDTASLGSQGLTL